MNPSIGAITVNGNIYLYWKYSDNIYTYIHNKYIYEPDMSKKLNFIDWYKIWSKWKQLKGVEVEFFSSIFKAGCSKNRGP